LLRETKKSKEFFFVWTIKGDVFCRKKLQDSPIVAIRDTKAARSLEGSVTEAEKVAIRKFNQQQAARWSAGSRNQNSGFSGNGRLQSPQPTEEAGGASSENARTS